MVRPFELTVYNLLSNMILRSWYVQTLPMYRHTLICCTVIHPDEKALPARLNMRLIEVLQTVVAPQVFTPRAVYDGRKNLFAARELPFGGSNSAEVSSALMRVHTMF